MGWFSSTTLEIFGQWKIFLGKNSICYCSAHHALNSAEALSLFASTWFLEHRRTLNLFPTRIWSLKAGGIAILPNRSCNSWQVHVEESHCISTLHCSLWVSVQLTGSSPASSASAAFDIINAVVDGVQAQHPSEEISYLFLLQLPLYLFIFLFILNLYRKNTFGGLIKPKSSVLHSPIWVVWGLSQTSGLPDANFWLSEILQLHLLCKMHLEMTHWLMRLSAIPKQNPKLASSL